MPASRLLLVAALSTVLAACGGGAATGSPSGDPPAGQEVTVEVRPARVSVLPGETVDFTSLVTGSADPSVTWEVVEKGGGTVSGTGTYVAPLVSGEYTVRASSKVSPSARGGAKVRVGRVAVAVSPKAATVSAGGSVAFTAAVAGARDPSVSWSVREPSGCGSIAPSGLYTAPGAAALCHVVATSVADPTAIAEATATVTAQPAQPPPPPVTTGWLSVSGKRIVHEDGTPFRGRGANLHDTRGCGACVYNAPVAAEVMRRMDELVDVWKASFVRLDLESYAAQSGLVNYAGVLDDPGYLADLKEIVAHAASKPGVYVLLSLWYDPTFTDLGWPTAATNARWAKLAETFKDEPRVLFGLVNEPESNYDGALDGQVWDAMNAAVQTIRDVEDAAGTPHHVITVQGTRGWSRVLDYYVTHPITAGGGVNVAYETHVYDPQSAFAARFENPSASLPVVIGEFGPVAGAMSEADCAALMQRAEAAGVPYLAWTFHMRCPPNLLVDGSGASCGVGMNLVPTSWGTLLKNRLAQPW